MPRCVLLLHHCFVKLELRALHILNIINDDSHLFRLTEINKPIVHARGELMANSIL